MRKVCVLVSICCAWSLLAGDSIPEKPKTRREIIRACRDSVVEIVRALPDGATMEILGTGFVVAEGGIVVTAKHVCDVLPKDNKLCVSRRTSTNLAKDSATILKEDESHDLALLKVESLVGVRPLEFEDPSSVEEGDDVLLMGFPLRRAELTTLRAMVAAKGDWPLKARDEPSAQFKLDCSAAEGMSGCPVVSATTGRVFAIVFGRAAEAGESLELFRRFAGPNLSSGGVNYTVLIKDLISNVNSGMSFSLSTVYIKKLLEGYASEKKDQK